jgi:hypothetical protein
MFKSVLTKIVFIAVATVSTAQAQQIFWKKQNVEIKFNGASATSTFNGIFQRVIVTPTTYECGYNQDPLTEVRQGTCYDVTCSGDGGKSPNWDAFYSAKKAEKASKLAAAIKGVGKTSADSLVAGGYFSSKPRTWEAFKTEVKKAAAAGAITEQVKTMVLSTYREDNMANLGYASGSCQHTAYACNEVVVVREGGYVPQTCVENVEQVLDQKAVFYTFKVQGATLLPTETETISVSLSGEPAESTVKSSYYNSYNAATVQNGNGTAVMMLQATGRKQVDLPVSGFQSVNLVANSANQATLQINVASSILPATASESLVVLYTVRTCTIGFLGACGIGWDKTENYTSKLTNTVSSFTVPATISGKKGVKMEVQVKVFKQNSMYHNANPVTATTNRITLK